MIHPYIQLGVGSFLGDGYSQPITITGTPTAGQVLTATSPTSADWQAGGSSSFTGIVQIQPIDGTSDDSDALWNLCNASAYKNAVMLLPGPAGQSFVINKRWGLPNGTYLIGTPGTRLVSTLNDSSGSVVGSSSAQVAPLTIPIFQGTNINLHANVPAGATTFTTTESTLTTSNAVQFLGTDLQQSNQLCFITNVSAPSSGVYTITLDRPIQNGFFIGRGDTVRKVTYLPQDIIIDGNGMTLTGTGDWLFAAEGYHCVVRNLRGDTSGGQPTLSGGGGIFLYDSSTYQCVFEGLYAQGFTNGGGIFTANTEDVIVKDCSLKNCQFSGGSSPAGFYQLTCINTKFINCSVENCNSDGFVIDGYSKGAVIDQCLAIECVGSGGFNVKAGSNTIINNCHADYCGSGFIFGSGSAPSVNGQIMLSNSSATNGTYGLQHNGATNVTVSNFQAHGNATAGISGGGAGFAMSNIDVSANTVNSLNITSNANITNLTATNSATGYCLTTPTAGINVTINGFNFSSTVGNGQMVGWNANSNLTLNNGTYVMNNAGNFCIQTVGACKISLSNITASGSAVATCGFFEVSGGTISIGQNVNLDAFDFAGPTNANYIYLGTANFLFTANTNSKTITASTYQVDSTGFIDNIIYTDSTSNAITITLPPPANYASRSLTLKDKTGQALTHNITINPNASEKIDGASSYVLNLNYASVILLCDGVNWNTVN